MKAKKKVIKALKIKVQLERMKKLYKQYDDLIFELFMDGFKELKLGNIKVMLVDNFSGKNVAFKTVSIKHFDLKEVKS